MATIKSVNRSSSTAFSPDSPYLAAGTMAGAVDLSFSSSANLEIFKLDFQSDDVELPLVAESPSSEGFNRLSWGKNPSGSEEFSMGLIAGGLVDGNIAIWNPQVLIRPEANANPLLSQLARHKGPVRGLEFNALSPNHLASGADEGEICIWDVVKPAEPTHFPPLKGSGGSTQAEISYLSWNSKVQHILAATSYNGTTVVWDLKKQKPVISFSDPNKRRCSVLQWHPDVATQLIVASDDDSCPSLRLWDMRNIMSPVKEYVGHSKGIIGMSWCQSDSSYLLTCAKDSRTICWDVSTAEIVSELPDGANWNLDVHWYPKISGVISATSFDGKINIFNMEGCSRSGIVENNSGAVQPLKAPKWYKRKAGVSFGFGGKLVSLCCKDSGASEVYVHEVVTEHSLVTRSSEFEAAVQNGEKSSLRLLCDKKSQESESEEDRETWDLLKVMLEDDGRGRKKLISHLGFSLPSEENNSVPNDLSQEVKAIDLEEKVAENGGSGPDKDNGTFLFEEKVGGSVPSSEELQQEPDVQEESAESSFDDAIQGALVVGDYKGATAQCISANKWADALVIAHVGGSLLWESTRDQYLKSSRSSYLKVVSAVVNNDLSSLVNTRPLKSWRETLALLCTFADREKWTLLCDTLAFRLLSVGNTLAATLCYICAGNIDKMVEIWSRSLATDQKGKSYVDLLQDLMEKTIVFALASGQKQFSASLCKLVEKYAEILASQGLLSTAMEFLKLLGTEEMSPELLILKDRIARSTETGMTSIRSEQDEEIEVNDEETLYSTQAGSRRRIDSKRRKSTSKLWDDFDRYIDPEGKDVAKCRHCKVKMAAGGNNGTSHLKKHIDLLRCPVLRNDPSRAKKLTPKVTSFQFDQERSREDLVKLISKHNLPFNMCEYEFFEYFCNNLNPEFKLMSRNTARADIMNVYTEEKQKLYDLFDGLSSKVSLTTDLWTSEYQSYAYVCVTAHYITDDWVLKKKIIAYRQIEFPHEGPRLFEVLKEIILDWNLEGKIMSIVVDNAKNNDVQTRLMREWMSNSNALPLGGELLHVRCSAHILNLVVQDGTSLLVGLISKIRASVRYLRKSAFAMQKFEVALAHEKLEHKRKIAMDIPIRWNSTYEMLATAVGVKKAFYRLSELDSNYRHNPSKEEWKRAEVICECFEMFLHATRHFSGTTYPTSNVFFPDVCKIKLKMRDWETSEHEFLRQISLPMTMKFEKYWDECALSLAIAVVLDPRLKIAIVEYYFKLLYRPIESVWRVKRVRDALDNLFDEYTEDSPINVAQTDYSGSFGGDMAGFYAWYESSRGSAVNAGRKSELDDYLDEAVFPGYEGFDILDWWKVNSAKLPTLARIARDILAVPATTAASEGAFSIRGRLLDETRTCLLSEVVEALMCTHDWIEGRRNNNRGPSSSTT